MTTNEDEVLEFNARFKSYPEPSEDGEGAVISLRQIALGMSPLILIEADQEQAEPTFNVSISDMPQDIAAFLMERIGSALAAQLEEDQN